MRIEPFCGDYIRGFTVYDYTVYRLQYTIMRDSIRSGCFQTFGFAGMIAFGTDIMFTCKLLEEDIPTLQDTQDLSLSKDKTGKRMLEQKKEENIKKLEQQTPAKQEKEEMKIVEDKKEESKIEKDNKEELKMEENKEELKVEENKKEEFVLGVEKNEEENSPHDSNV